MQLDYNQALQIIQKSTILFPQKEVYDNIKVLANKIENDIKGDIPIFLTVMNGGLFFAAELLKQIKSPFTVDYIHASRYGDETSGSNKITWYHKPKIEDLKGKTVFIIDDILDEGHTLLAIQDFLAQCQVKSSKVVVLVDKDIGKHKPIQADYIGMTSPNHFLFGFGMDIFGLYRQLPDIYIYNQS